MCVDDSQWREPQDQTPQGVLHHCLLEHLRLHLAVPHLVCHDAGRRGGETDSVRFRRKEENDMQCRYFVKLVPNESFYITVVTKVMQLSWWCNHGSCIFCFVLLEIIKIELNIITLLDSYFKCLFIKFLIEVEV